MATATVHGVAERRGDRVAGKNVERIGHGEGSATVGRGDRQRTHLAQEFDLQPIEKERSNGIVRGRHERCPEQLRQRFGEPAFAHQPELGQHLVEPAPGFGGDATGTIQRALVDRPAVDEEPCRAWRAPRWGLRRRK